MEELSVMIIGGGAREHVLSDAYEESGQVGKVIVIPGNDLIPYRRKKEVLIDKDCSLTDTESLVRLAQKYKPDLVDVAQDDALASGTVDLLRKHGFSVFGPTKEAARIEWDKGWARGFMAKNGIPHPGYTGFSSVKEAIGHAEELYRTDPERLLYVKANGLCQGKGALKSTNLEEAIQNIRLMESFPNRAGVYFLIEEGLKGEEFSCFAISDGKEYRVFKSAQDNKTIGNFDQGDQTGGMGAVSPARVTEGIEKNIMDLQVSKVFEGMRSEGIAYQGVLFLGGIVDKGESNTIEYNARWGDPECQAVLPALETDYARLVTACIDGRLGEMEFSQDSKARVCVVGSSRGYPQDHSAVKGKRVFGLEEAMGVEGVKVYGSGIRASDGKFFAEGGRLFSVVGCGKDIREAKQKAYAAMAYISVEGNNLHYRTDIGWRDIERSHR